MYNNMYKGLEFYSKVTTVFTNSACTETHTFSILLHKRQR